MKKIILSVALFVPILVFIFFKLFGKNQFDVPVYWSNGVNVDGCPPAFGPYTLPDSTLSVWGWKHNKATLLVLDEKNIRKNLARVADQFDQGEYQTIEVDNTRLPTCLLLAGDSSKVLLIDEEKRIRGYYTPTTQKETDRLAVELKILLKQY